LAKGKPYGQIAEELGGQHVVAAQGEACNLPDLVRVEVQLLAAEPA
jgi:hypothetical protein